jgi:hypothetical protein
MTATHEQNSTLPTGAVLYFSLALAFRQRASVLIDRSIEEPRCARRCSRTEARSRVRRTCPSAGFRGPPGDSRDGEPQLFPLLLRLLQRRRRVALQPGKGRTILGWQLGQASLSRMPARSLAFCQCCKAELPPMLALALHHGQPSSTSATSWHRSPPDAGPVEQEQPAATSKPCRPRSRGAEVLGHLGSRHFLITTFCNAATSDAAFGPSVTSCRADLTSWWLGTEMTSVEVTSRCAGGALGDAPVGVSGDDECLRCQRTLVSSRTNCSTRSFSASTRPGSAHWAEPGSQRTSRNIERARPRRTAHRSRRNCSRCP